MDPLAMKADNRVRAINAVRVAVVETGARETDRLGLALTGSSGFICAGVFSDARNALKSLKRNIAEVVVLDTQMEGWCGIPLLRALKEVRPALKVIVCAAANGLFPVRTALQAGADGYLAKPLDAGEVAAAVAAVCRNETPLSPSVASLLVRTLRSVAPVVSPSVALLTKRELEIMTYVRRGQLDKEIAAALLLSVLTVKRHLHNVYLKLKVDNRVEAIQRISVLESAPAACGPDAASNLSARLEPPPIHERRSRNRARRLSSPPAKNRDPAGEVSPRHIVRRRLLVEAPATPKPTPLVQSLTDSDWCAQELAGLDLGDPRLARRAQLVLGARWQRPAASFNASFETWGAAKGAYAFVEHKRQKINFQSLVAPHREATLARMAAEPMVLLPLDTTTIDYSRLRHTTGLGPLGLEHEQGLWLRNLLAFRPDGVPLGVLHSHCWSRPTAPRASALDGTTDSRDLASESPWLEAFRALAAVAPRIPQTRLVVIVDHQDEVFQLPEQVQIEANGPRTLIRTLRRPELASHRKLWAFLAAQPVGLEKTLTVPRHTTYPGREAAVELRWAPLSPQAALLGCSNGSSASAFWAVWARERPPVPRAQPLDWMLLTDSPVHTGEEAWEKVQWYRCRSGFDEWYGILKTACRIEQHEFKSAEHLQRALAFDLIIAWRILAYTKLALPLPHSPAKMMHAKDEAPTENRDACKESADACKGWR